MDKRTVANSLRTKASIWRDLADVEALAGSRTSSRQQHREAMAHFDTERVYRKVAKELMDYAVAVDSITIEQPLAGALARTFSSAPLTQRAATSR